MSDLVLRDAALLRMRSLIFSKQPHPEEAAPAAVSKGEVP